MKKRKKQKVKSFVEKGKEKKEIKQPSFAISRAYVSFPIGRAHRLLREYMEEEAGIRKPRISAEVPVRVAAILEYLCCEVMEIAGNICKNKNLKRIDETILEEVFESDTELKELQELLKKKPDYVYESDEDEEITSDTEKLLLSDYNFNEKSLDVNRLRCGMEVPPRWTKDHPKAKFVRFKENTVAELTEVLKLDEGMLTYTLDAGNFYVKKPLYISKIIKELKLILPEDDKNIKKLEKMKYGDVIDFGWYRGCGVWFLGGNPNKLRLMKSYGEMGYGIPIEFYDHPVGFFDGWFNEVTNIREIPIDPLRMDGVSPKTRDLIEKSIELIKRDGLSDGNYENVVNEQGENVVVASGWSTPTKVREDFPKGFWVIRVDEKPAEVWDDYISVTFSDPRYFDEVHDLSLFEKNYEKRRKKKIIDTLVCILGTLNHLLPTELCLEISYNICEIDKNLLFRE